MPATVYFEKKKNKLLRYKIVNISKLITTSVCAILVPSYL